MGAMRDAKAVMVWRQVKDLAEAEKALRGNGIKWEKVGEDEYTAIFDAGTTLLAFWIEPPEEMARPELRQDACSILNFIRSDLVINPASELVLDVRPEHFEDGVSALLNTYRPGASFVSAPLSIASEREGFAPAGWMPKPALREPQSLSGRISFYDGSGNLFSFASERGAPSPGLSALHRRMVSSQVTGKEGLPLVVEHRRMVSDLSRSLEFYWTVLELDPIGESEFRSGLLRIGLVEEPQLGLLDSLKQRNRFNSEWLVLHVEDVGQAAEELQSRGVEFPEGIETSDSGTLAAFRDPDGHTIAVWSPPDERHKPKIELRPQIHRIVAAGQ